MLLRQAAHDARLHLPASNAARAAVRVAEGHGNDGADWAYVSEMHAAPWASLAAPPTSVAPRSAAAPAPITSLEALRASVPPPRTDGLKLKMRCGVLAARRGAPLAVIDDDPTGTQTVHSVPVLADWEVETLQAALSEDVACFYILANTRALTPDAAEERAVAIGTNLKAAAGRLGIDPMSLGVVSHAITAGERHCGDAAATDEPAP